MAEKKTTKTPKKKVVEEPVKSVIVDQPVAVYNIKDVVEFESNGTGKLIAGKIYRVNGQLGMELEKLNRGKILGKVK